LAVLGFELTLAKQTLDLLSHAPSLLFFFSFFRLDLTMVTQVGLELLSAGITGVHHHAFGTKYGIKGLFSDSQTQTH
jgi:hypothetical protein